MKVINRIKHLRRKNWSAPITMSVFIIICMIVVFSFETLGLSNKERNLEYRKSREIIHKPFENLNKNEPEPEIDQSVFELLNHVSKTSKSHSLGKINSMLLDAAQEQLRFSYLSNSMNEIQFYDI
jgi:hypothetical protein